MAQKSLQIELEAEPDCPRIFGDRRRLEQIMSNLLNNAIKFSPTGGLVQLAIHHINQDVQICVADRGPGVPTEAQEKIFDKFHIATDDQALAGSGLGLFIARALVRLHNGRIWLENRPDGGSRFCFTIPISPPEAQNAESQ